MHCSLVLMVVLPVVTSFILPPAPYSATHYCIRSKSTAAAPETCYRNSDGARVIRWHGGNKRTGIIRRDAGGGANMDGSDEVPDDEIYGSLRKRLEELERASLQADKSDEPATTRDLKK